MSDLAEKNNILDSTQKKQTLLLTKAQEFRVKSYEFGEEAAFSLGNFLDGVGRFTFFIRATQELHNPVHNRRAAERVDCC